MCAQLLDAVVPSLDQARERLREKLRVVRAMSKVSESSEPIAMQASNNYVINMCRGGDVVALVRRRRRSDAHFVTCHHVTKCKVDMEGNVSNEDGPFAHDELLVVADSEESLLSRVRMDAEALLSDAELHVTRIDDVLRIERLAAFLREWM